MPNCNKGKPCGRACIPQTSTCRKAPTQVAGETAAQTAARAIPNCRTGKLCGRACIPQTKVCRKTPGLAPLLPAAQPAGPTPASTPLNPARLTAAVAARRAWTARREQVGSNLQDPELRRLEAEALLALALAIERPARAPLPRAPLTETNPPPPPPANTVLDIRPDECYGEVGVI